MLRGVRALALLLALAGFATAAAAAPVREEVVPFAAPDGVELGGILSLPPKGDGPFPGLLLLHGSGLHDADHEIDDPEQGRTRGPQEHFKKLARFLSRKGFAVLRYNKRGASFDHRSDNPILLQVSTLDDLADDAATALDVLAADPRVAADTLVVWGWSEGTMIAPILARQRPEVAAIVLVGPVARDPERLLRYQLVDRYLDFYRRAADGDGNGAVSLAELDRLDGSWGVSSFFVYNLAFLLFGVTGAEIEAGATVTGFRSELDLDGDGELAIDTELAPWLEVLLEDTVAEFRTVPYLASFLDAEPPVRRIQKVRAQILIVQGEADNQTPLAEGLALAEKLERRKRTNWELLRFPGLGHSLAPQIDVVTGDGGLTVLDNPSFQVMKRRTLRTIWKSLRGRLGL